MHLLMAIEALLAPLDSSHQLSLRVLPDPSEAHLVHTTTECSALEHRVSPTTIDLRAPARARTCEECEENLIGEASFTELGTPWSPAHVETLCALLDFVDQLEGLARELRRLDLATLTPAELFLSSLHDAAASLELVSMLRDLPTLGSALLQAAADALEGALAEVDTAFAARLSSEREHVTSLLRAHVSLSLGASELLELEDDEVLVGVQEPRSTSRSPRGAREEVILRTFAIRRGNHALPWVLRAPRFVGQLVYAAAPTLTQLAPAPVSAAACEVAAGLWDPSLTTGLTSLLAATRTATDTLTCVS